MKFALSQSFGLYFLRELLRIKVIVDLKAEIYNYRNNAVKLLISVALSHIVTDGIYLA
jgi:hypothetical protein